MNNREDILQAIAIGLVVATFLLHTGRSLKAIELCKECLIFLNNEVLKMEKRIFNTFNIRIYQTIFGAYCLIPDYTKALIYGRKLLDIYRECGKTEDEENLTVTLANIFEQQYKYAEARQLYERAMNIVRETGDKKEEAFIYDKFGIMSYYLAEYDKAKKYINKALVIRIEIGDIAGKATCYGNLGTVFKSLGEYDKAKEYFGKALAIKIKTDDRAGEASCYGNLGTVFQSLGEYDKVKEYHGKALTIQIEIGDRAGEAICYGNLGNAFQSLGEYDKAKEYLEEALAIKIQIGDRAGEARCYGNLGTVFESLGEFDKAKKILEKALAIRTEIDDRKGEAADYINLGTTFKSLGEYDRAKKILEKALAITIEISDRAGEASCYGTLGTVFQSAAEYDKAKEYLDKALAIRIQIDDREGESADYANLGAMFKFLGEYDKAKEYLEKALAIKIEIGDRAGEASCYGNLGTVFQSLGNYEKAKEYLERALAIRIDIGDRAGEAADYGNLGALYQYFGEYVMAEVYIEKALSITRDIGDLSKEFIFLCNLTMVKLRQDKIQQAFECLVLSISKSETLRRFLRDNDEFKISFSDVRDFPYRCLSAAFCFSAIPNHALYVLELARARALADLMAYPYSVDWQISADSESWIGIENIMKKECNCSCLYISYYDQHLFFWVLKTSGIINFRRITVDEKLVGAGLVGNLDDFFAKSFRGFGILAVEDCEDRSFNAVGSKLKTCQEEGLAALQLVEDNDERGQNPESSLSLCHRMLIGPVADLLKEREIIIVSDRSLNQVPFAALRDEDGKYLSETFRIRIVPSLTTLKLIQDSPADYHSQTGALVVGDPDVGWVHYKGRIEYLSRLPCAANEAAMSSKARLYGVKGFLSQSGGDA